jgi:osmotically-inducible protein OsmY
MASVHNDLVQKVHGTLTRDSRIRLNQSDITISEDSGYVTLSGTVPSVAAKRLALGQAQTVSGVKSVTDDLRVAPAQVMGDLEIADHVRHSLLQERNIEQENIDIQTDADGGVILRGHVHSLIQKRLCEVLCWWVPGVTAVTNLIVIEPKEEDNDEELKDNLITIMEKDVLVNPKKFRLEVRQGRVTLRGQVDSPTERSAAENDCWFTPGVVDVVNDLTLSS